MEAGGWRLRWTHRPQSVAIPAFCLMGTPVPMYLPCPPSLGKGKEEWGVSFCSLKGVPHSKDQNSGTVQLAGTGARSSCDPCIWGAPDSVALSVCGELQGTRLLTFQKGQERVGGAVLSFSQPRCGPWTSHPPSVGLSFPILPSKPSDPDVPKVSTFSLSISLFLAGGCRTMSFRH